MHREDVDMDEDENEEMEQDEAGGAHDEDGGRKKVGFSALSIYSNHVRSISRELAVR